MPHSETHARRRLALALTAVLATCIVSADALAATGDQKCSATKLKAAAQKFSAKAKCHQKAILKGTSTDAECLSKAETKFNETIVKADAAGSCVGSAAEIETIVDDCLAALPSEPDPGVFTLTSPTIPDGGTFPLTHVCAGRGGMNQSPQLAWSDPPAGTMGFAMVLTDTTNDLVQSVFYDIPSSLSGLPANVERAYAPASVPGMHTTNAYDMQRGWAGPCPNTAHSYEIAVYAIDSATLPGSTSNTTSAQAKTALESSNLGVAKLTATFTP